MLYSSIHTSILSSLITFSHKALPGRMPPLSQLVKTGKPSKKQVTPEPGASSTPGGSEQTYTKDWSRNLVRSKSKKVHEPSARAITVVIVGGSRAPGFAVYPTPHSQPGLDCNVSGAAKLPRPLIERHREKEAQRSAKAHWDTWAPGPYAPLTPLKRRETDRATERTRTRDKDMSDKDKTRPGPGPGQGPGPAPGPRPDLPVPCLSGPCLPVTVPCLSGFYLS